MLTFEHYDGRYVYFQVLEDDWAHYQYDTKKKTVKLIWKQ